jgi:hypothetical protein
MGNAESDDSKLKPAQESQDDTPGPVCAGLRCRGLAGVENSPFAFSSRSGLGRGVGQHTLLHWQLELWCT